MDSARPRLPDVEANESVADYQACLQTLGLQSSVETLPDTDLDTGDGDVVFADPEAGENVDPDTTVKVVKNPNTPTARPEPRCEPADGEGPNPIPATRRPTAARSRSTSSGPRIPRRTRRATLQASLARCRSGTGQRTGVGGTS
jgi:hypothetical protein